MLEEKGQTGWEMGTSAIVSTIKIKTKILMLIDNLGHLYL